jgi:AcrR family transcriptional regulator
MTNREKILNESRKLFNKKGYGAVTLFEIAQTTGISRGNITYHFKDKDKILEALVNELWDKIEVERVASRAFPSFENLHNEARQMIRIQKDFSFVFLDSVVQRHPLIRKHYQSINDQTIEDFKSAIAFSIQSGNMNPETYNGMYNNLALICWTVAFYWLPQQVIVGKDIETESEKIIWTILIPHFTEKGMNAFRKFFGDEYLNSLGSSFNKKIDNLISF